MNNSDSKEHSIFFTIVWYFIRFVFISFLLALLPERYCKGEEYLFSALITYFIAGFGSYLIYKKEMEGLSFKRVNLKNRYFKTAFLCMYFVAVITNIYTYNYFWSYGYNEVEEAILNLVPFLLAIVVGTFIVYWSVSVAKNKD